MNKHFRFEMAWCRSGWNLAFAGVLCLWGAVKAEEKGFRHHFIDQTLPQNARLQGDYGLTALVDIDKDGDLDFVLGGRQPAPDRLYWFEYQAADRWLRHDVGTGYQSDVGLAAIDVDGDGWSDL